MDSAHRSGWEIAEVVFGLPFLIGLVLHFVVPIALPGWVVHPALIAVGILLVLAGLRLIGLARRELAAFHQPTDPGQPTGRLVTSGVYAFSRNPLYLAGGLVFLGFDLALRSPWALGMLLVSLILCHAVLILPEERYLAAKFGGEYTAYAAAVHRWLGRK